MVSALIERELSAETFPIRHGVFVAVVGPSGAGKSSFLRLLNRLDEPTAGTVLFEGVDYRLIPPRELVEVSSSFVKGLVGPAGWENVLAKYVPQAVHRRFVLHHTKSMNEPPR